MRALLAAIGTTTLLAGALTASMALADGAAAAHGRAPAATGGRIVLAQACGWYIVLGCTRGYRDASRILADLGGPGVGGGAGTNVIDTNTFPNFADGWFCVADGPYRTRADADSIAWREAVPDAYVKNGC